MVSSRFAGALAALACCSVAVAGDLPVIALPLGGEQIAVEIAATDAALQRGLQGHRSMPDNAGMLLVLPDAALRCVWMKDTLIPLSAAFLDAAGAVLTLADMAPLSTEFHCSAPSARYVLEMNQGWFARHGIAVGARVDLGGLY